MFDNMNIILAIIALCVSIISNILMISRNAIKYKKMKMDFKDIKLILETSEKIDLGQFDIEDYSKELIEKISKIYPNAIFSLSIKLVKNVDKEKPEESKIFTWFRFPQQGQREENLYTIKNNTDFYTLIEECGKFFFVSDLKKYSALVDYKNENQSYIQKYNTTIVYPIRKKGKDKKYDTIGFLCVDSPQKLNNVKKNEKVLSLVETAASIIYDFLSQNKDKQEILSIKQ